MPRIARSWLDDGAFHVTVRGNGRQPIFETVADAGKLLSLIDASGLDVVAYCLMPNHFHLIVVALVAELGRAMGRINGGYAQWFNRKYDRTGHLFQGRFKAKPIESERHLYEAIRYVLLNPVRAGLCSHPADWPWCNWNDFAHDEYLVGLIDESLRGPSPKGAVPGPELPLTPARAFVPAAAGRGASGRSRSAGSRSCPRRSR